MAVTGRNEVSLLRSFKRHPTTKSLTSATISKHEDYNTSKNICSSINLLRDTHNFTTTASAPTNTENLTKTARKDDRISLVKNEEDTVSSTGEVYVSEGIVERETSLSSSSVVFQQATATVTDSRSSRSKKGECLALATAYVCSI